jgi:hypothetical protein
MTYLRQSTIRFYVGLRALQTDMILAVPDYLPDLRTLHLTQPSIMTRFVAVRSFILACLPTELIYFHQDRQCFPDALNAIAKILPRMRRLHRLKWTIMEYFRSLSMPGVPKIMQISVNRSVPLECMGILREFCVCLRVEFHIFQHIHSSWLAFKHEKHGWKLFDSASKAPW